MQRNSATEYDREILDLFDDYVHGRTDRRGFVHSASKLVAGTAAAEAVLESLSPNYAWAEQVAPDDPRITTERIHYHSPQGGGKIEGLLATPTGEARHPAVVVVHENRGLNPYIEDVARRLAVAGFTTVAPDALSPLGGYPGNDDDGRTMQRKRDAKEMTEDFVSAAKWIEKHPRSTGKVGVVGFCFGGGMANQLAVQIPDVIRAAIPFYGRQPAQEDVSKIKAQLLIHYAEHDRRINAGWPAYEEALKANDVSYQTYFYPGVNHGFHNDTTPRFDEQAAELAWKRTLEFFREKLS